MRLPTLCASKHTTCLSAKRSHRMAMNWFASLAPLTVHPCTTPLDGAPDVFGRIHAAKPFAALFLVPHPFGAAFRLCKSAALGSGSRSSTSCGRDTCTHCSFAPCAHSIRTSMHVILCIVLLRSTSYIHVIVLICLKRVNRHGWCECRFCMEQKPVYYGI